MWHNRDFFRLNSDRKRSWLGANLTHFGPKSVHRVEEAVKVQTENIKETLTRSIVSLAEMSLQGCQIMIWCKKRIKLVPNGINSGLLQIRCREKSVKIMPRNFLIFVSIRANLKRFGTKFEIPDSLYGLDTFVYLSLNQRAKIGAKLRFCKL